jgi:hypothetical protein
VTESKVRFLFFVEETSEEEFWFSGSSFLIFLLLLCPFRHVVGNYALEGSYYPGCVDSVSHNGSRITVVYDDDGSEETLTKEHVRLVIPLTATQTDLGGPLSDEEAFGDNGDEKISIEVYQLKAELAQLVANSGDKVRASELFEEASSEAMEAGKMKTATEFSLKASELLE